MGLGISKFPLRTRITRVSLLQLARFLGKQRFKEEKLGTTKVIYAQQRLRWYSDELLRTQFYFFVHLLIITSLITIFPDLEPAIVTLNASV